MSSAHPLSQPALLAFIQDKLKVDPKEARRLLDTTFVFGPKAHRCVRCLCHACEDCVDYCDNCFPFDPKYLVGEIDKIEDLSDPVLLERFEGLGKNHLQVVFCRQNGRFYWPDTQGSAHEESSDTPPFDAAGGDIQTKDLLWKNEGHIDCSNDKQCVYALTDAENQARIKAITDFDEEAMTRFGGGHVFSNSVDADEHYFARVDLDGVACAVAELAVKLRAAGVNDAEWTWPSGYVEGHHGDEETKP